MIKLCSQKEVIPDQDGTLSSWTTWKSKICPAPGVVQVQNPSETKKEDNGTKMSKPLVAYCSDEEEVDDEIKERYAAF